MVVLHLDSSNCLYCTIITAVIFNEVAVDLISYFEAIHKAFAVVQDSKFHFVPKVTMVHEQHPNGEQISETTQDSSLYNTGINITLSPLLHLLRQQHHI